MPDSYWDVSIMALEKDGKRIYKVTRRVLSLSVSETKFFAGKAAALRQFYEWLE